MEAKQALEQIRIQLQDIEQSDMTVAELQISKIVARFFRCICKPGSPYLNSKCQATEHI